MIDDLPFQWTKPSTWPWMVYIWLAFFLAGWLKPLWRWLQQERFQRWPTAQGQIERVWIEQKKQWLASTDSRLPKYIAELTYSYKPEAEAHSGCWRQEFASAEEAEDFVRDLRGKSVLVSYDPGKPSHSALLKDAITAVLATRTPALEAGRVPAQAAAIPVWVEPLLWPFILLSAIGLGLSLWVHFGAVAGKKVAPEPFFWMLHAGIFIVWFPAVLIANRRVGNTRRKDYWDAVFRGSPAWFKYVVYIFVGYAILNFLLFIPQAPAKGTGTTGETPVVVWRGFSGYWMAFYAAALTILYSAVRSPSESRIEPPWVRR